LNVHLPSSHRREQLEANKRLCSLLVKMTRKRKCSPSEPLQPRKKPRPNQDDQSSPAVCSVLSLSYHKVLTLRNYFLSKLPSSSRVRRKRLEKYTDLSLTSLLDTCVVGVLSEPTPEIQEERAREFVSFTQPQETARQGLTARSQTCSLDEVCDQLSFYISNLLMI
jgi:hypothetical protein